MDETLLRGHCNRSGVLLMNIVGHRMRIRNLRSSSIVCSVWFYIDMRMKHVCSSQRTGCLRIGARGDLPNPLTATPLTRQMNSLQLL
jgi:hypothetical protein